MLYSGRKVVVGVCGGIAAYKSCELVRELRRRGASVRVMMTPAARAFVSPMTFAALSEHPVLTDHLAVSAAAEIEHLSWARWAEVMVICPATANTLARLAHGFADEPVSATVCAARVPVVICPAMNGAMWEDVRVQHNVSRLREQGSNFVGPEFGAFATSGEGEGWGRLARVEWILSAILQALQPQQPLAGRKVLVTAGRTEEYFDPVRMITNPASGRMGFAVAEMARALGADPVVLVHGPTALPPPHGVRCVPVVSAAEMAAAVYAHYAGTDLLVMSAAVSDYRPRTFASEKIKKQSGVLVLELEPTEDILAVLGRRKSHAVHVGFALETENEVENARDKLRRKNLDLIVLNNPKAAGAGFGTETNQVTLIDAQGGSEALPLLSKLEVANAVLQRVLAMWSARC